MTIDKSGVITSANNAARVLFGFPALQMVGTPVAKLMPDRLGNTHQSYIDKYVKTGISSGAIGEWKERAAVRYDGEPFDIKVALSVTMKAEEPVFSAMIDPLYAAEIRSDDKGNMIKATGSCWLLFGVYREVLIGQHVNKIVKHSESWFVLGERVLVCRTFDGEEFTALLKVRKEKNEYVGTFTEAPNLTVKMKVLESGSIIDVTGEPKALLGFKPKHLKGKPITDLIPPVRRKW